MRKGQWGRRRRMICACSPSSSAIFLSFHGLQSVHSLCSSIFSPFDGLFTAVPDAKIYDVHWREGRRTKQFIRAKGLLPLLLPNPKGLVRLNPSPPFLPSSSFCRNPRLAHYGQLLPANLGSQLNYFPLPSSPLPRSPANVHVGRLTDPPPPLPSLPRVRPSIPFSPLRLYKAPGPCPRFFRQHLSVQSIPFGLLCHRRHLPLLPILLPPLPFVALLHQPIPLAQSITKKPSFFPVFANSMIAIFLFALFLLVAKNSAESAPGHDEQQAPPEVEKRMLSYADLMNNFGGPSSLDFFGAPGNSPLFMLDEERPKREEGDEDGMQLSLWKRSPLARGFMSGAHRNYLMKKDEFVAPGVLRFGKRMPGVLRFGKRDPGMHEKKAVPGVLRFGKREAPEGAVPGVLRFGKRMPQVLRFG